jgi:hypothetical protein
MAGSWRAGGGAGAQLCRQVAGQTGLQTGRRAEAVRLEISGPMDRNCASKMRRRWSGGDDAK